MSGKTEAVMERQIITDPAAVDLAPPANEVPAEEQGHGDLSAIQANPPDLALDVFIHSTDPSKITEAFSRLVEKGEQPPLTPETAGSYARLSKGFVRIDNYSNYTELSSSQKKLQLKKKNCHWSGGEYEHLFFQGSMDQRCEHILKASWMSVDEATYFESGVPGDSSCRYNSKIWFGNAQTICIKYKDKEDRLSTLERQHSAVRTAFIQSCRESTPQARQVFSESFVPQFEKDVWDNFLQNRSFDGVGDILNDYLPFLDACTTDEVSVDRIGAILISYILNSTQGDENRETARELLQKMNPGLAEEVVRAFRKEALSSDAVQALGTLLVFDLYISDKKYEQWESTEMSDAVYDVFSAAADRTPGDVAREMTRYMAAAVETGSESAIVFAIDRFVPLFLEMAKSHPDIAMPYVAALLEFEPYQALAAKLLGNMGDVAKDACPKLADVIRNSPSDAAAEAAAGAMARIDTKSWETAAAAMSIRNDIKMRVTVDKGFSRMAHAMRRVELAVNRVARSMDGVAAATRSVAAAIGNIPPPQVERHIYVSPPEVETRKEGVSPFWMGAAIALGIYSIFK